MFPDNSLFAKCALLQGVGSREQAVGSRNLTFNGQRFTFHILRSTVPVCLVYWSQIYLVVGAVSTATSSGLGIVVSRIHSLLQRSTFHVPLHLLTFHVPRATLCALVPLGLFFKPLYLLEE